MASFLAKHAAWQMGYRTIGLIQLSLAFILLLSLGLWKRIDHQDKNSNLSEKTEKRIERKHNSIKIKDIKGLKYAVATFMFYCTAELSVGLWGSTYLVNVKEVPIETAARWIAMYYGGITVGRFISGFISFKLNNKQMIRLGVNIATAGAILLILPIPTNLVIIPLILIGLGFAPIFPAMIHETPVHFGREASQAAIGYQMGFGYMGSALLPPLIGVIIKNTTVSIFPIFIIGSIVIIYFSVERLTRITGGRHENRTYSTLD